MYLMYIDESGDTITLQQNGSSVLVLTGCIIDEKGKRDIESSFREIKKKYYQNSEIEIKSNYLRYANPKIIDPEKFSPIKLYDQQQYNLLQTEIQGFLKKVSKSNPWKPGEEKEFKLKTDGIEIVYADYVPPYVLFEIALKAEDPVGYNFDENIKEIELVDKWEKDIHSKK